MGLFKKKTEPVKTMTSITPDSFDSIDNAEEEETITPTVIDEAANVSTEQIEQTKEILKPQTDDSDTLARILTDFGARITNIEARLFRSGL